VDKPVALHATKDSTPTQPVFLIANLVLLDLMAMQAVSQLVLNVLLVTVKPHWAVPPVWHAHLVILRAQGVFPLVVHAQRDNMLPLMLPHNVVLVTMAITSLRLVPHLVLCVILGLLLMRLDKPNVWTVFLVSLPTPQVCRHVSLVPQVRVRPRMGNPLANCVVLEVLPTWVVFRVVNHVMSVSSPMFLGQLNVLVALQDFINLPLAAQHVSPVVQALLPLLVSQLAVLVLLVLMLLEMRVCHAHLVTKEHTNHHKVEALAYHVTLVQLRQLWVKRNVLNVLRVRLPIQLGCKGVSYAQQARVNQVLGTPIVVFVLLVLMPVQLVYQAVLHVLEVNL